MGSLSFEQLKATFETLQAMQPNRDPGARDAELLAQLAVYHPSFPDDYRAYLHRERERIEETALGHVVDGNGERSSWYDGPKSQIGIWPLYRTKLASRLPDQAVAAVDDSTSQILSRCANPRERGDRRKGLVIGYVQSGKTANYAGLIAKAVDAGYRIIIVLAGMHSNLRAQTQARLDSDLHLGELKVGGGGVAWHPLTDVNSDIAPTNQIGLVGNSGNAIVMVVKKNEKRLAHVLTFLKNIAKSDPEILRSRATLVIDDESDQATPNTLGGKQLISTINKRIRDIWAAIPTGTYVAYTATPFANIFANPNDPGDLYPDDFAVVLPRPEGYMGADTFFDTSRLADEEGAPPDALAREIDDVEAAILAPSGRDLSKYEPHITESLGKAIRWFLIATAIRQLRIGRASHSSMLLHTSHRVEAHDRLRDVVRDFLTSLALEREHRRDDFRVTFEEEIDRAVAFRGDEVVPAWNVVWAAVEELLARVQVRVDNGQSDERLAYPDDDPQTVIAIGGGTLSRGLTLEGLVVSYFLRTSNTYDTLLQMGRWFGFRPRYQDLARVWAASGMLDDYAHLALVERELRDDIELMAREGKTPRELAIPVLAHRGRLQITGPGKLAFVDLVHTGLGGTRRQTIYLDRSEQGLRRSHAAARALVQRAVESLEHLSAGVRRTGNGASAHLFRGLDHDSVVEFLDSYWVPSPETALQPQAMREWTSTHGNGKSWDLVLVSGPASNNAQFQYSPGIEVNVVSRAPLAEGTWSTDRFAEEIEAGADIVNIRALMSSADYTLDLSILGDNGLLTEAQQARLKTLNKSNAQDVRRFRKEVRPDSGVILLYAVSKDSTPEKKSSGRTFMGAADHLIGLGAVFPAAELERDGDYYAVEVQSIFDTGDVEEHDEIDLAPIDIEADFKSKIEDE
ncbi:hypothetical protein E4U02_14470 [Microbacterium paludicola]|uniref:Putative endonuclease Z1 domain-containing protein n=1 Tax=Microbacterium paludicola TaxID=300019 RepID=A0A4Y9FNJ0_9MICO|nr:Z1 domain-containing protein [Microbacterium paludicola]MBF0817608.1 Z1 domain-containing protein [Microbacterium paludicola]TFU30586.1 hypothetical protein E4U02_14470 [Microbacterium paludicola]